MKPNNVQDGNYLAYQEGWVVTFYFGKRLITFKAKQEIETITACEVKVVNNEFQVIYE